MNLKSLFVVSHLDCAVVDTICQKVNCSRYAHRLTPKIQYEDSNILFCKMDRPRSCNLKLFSRVAAGFYIQPMSVTK